MHAGFRTGRHCSQRRNHIDVHGPRGWIDGASRTSSRRVRRRFVTLKLDNDHWLARSRCPQTGPAKRSSVLSAEVEQGRMVVQRSSSVFRVCRETRPQIDVFSGHLSHTSEERVGAALLVGAGRLGSRKLVRTEKMATTAGRCAHHTLPWLRLALGPAGRGRTSEALRLSRVPRPRAQSFASSPSPSSESIYTRCIPILSATALQEVE
jgi:hypothetical protein